MPSYQDDMPLVSATPGNVVSLPKKKRVDVTQVFVYQRCEGKEQSCNKGIQNRYIFINSLCWKSFVVFNGRT